MPATPHKPPRLVGLDVIHPQRGEGAAYARLCVSRNLASGKVDDVPLTRGQLVILIRDAAEALDILGLEG